MNILKAAAAAAALAAFGSAGAMAQDTYKNTDTIQKPPAMAPSPAPSTTAPSSEGMSTGEGGVDSPAGIPADPNTNQNVQPGPSTGTPNDPAAGSNPGARAPTSPPGTGTSSP
jgi:hypothetical protein